MGEITGRLLRVWFGWTLALGLLLLAGGFVYGFGPRWIAAAIIAGFISLGIAGRCVRAWRDCASVLWFWWR